MSPIHGGNRNHAVTTIVWVVLIAAGFAYARQVEWWTMLAVARQAAPAGLALAFALHALALVAKAGIWWICLRALATPAFRTVLRITFVGAALNSLAVANSGEAGRVLLISRASGIRTPGALATVVLEHLIRTGGFVIFIAAAALLTRVSLPHDRATLAVLAAVAVAIVLLGGRRSRARRRRFIAWRRAPRVARVVRAFLLRTVASGRRILTPELLALTAPFTLVVWMCELGSYHLVARAAQLPLSLTGSLIALLSVNLGFVLRATPANIGVFELSYAAAAVAQGAPAGAALAVGMLIHLVQDVPTIVLGLVLGRPLLRSAPEPITPVLAPVIATAVASGELPGLPSNGGTTP